MMDLACACQAKSAFSHGQIFHFTVAVALGHTASTPVSVSALADQIKFGV